MPHLAPDITLALSQFFQNDDPGLALTLQVGTPSSAPQQQSLPLAVESAVPAEPACA
jgi:hypothetical protein